jgi:hypothetical protein
MNKIDGGFSLKENVGKFLFRDVSKIKNKILVIKKLLEF